jgi:Uma2 family endonuclease
MATRLQERLLTAEQLAKKRVRYACELVEGRIVRVSPAGRVHGLVLANVNELLTVFVRRKKLGRVVSGETGFLVKRNPDTVRAPDVAFVSNELIARGSASNETYFPCAPELAVEVLSPDDRWEDVEKKVAEYLAAEGKLVWVVSPQLEKIWIYEPGSEGRAFGRKDRVDGGEALPGLRVAVKAFFA